MRRGERQRFVVGVGHGTCTCEGAAFEYIVNLEFELRARGVRDRADIVWLTNEYELGDFGMGGMQFSRGGYITPSSMFNASLFAERGIDWITRAHPRRSSRVASTTRRWTARLASRHSTSPCCSPRSPASASPPSTGTGPRSPSTVFNRTAS